MTERRKRKRLDSDEEPEKLTKVQAAVGKYLLWSLPSREGKLVGMTVKIFLASEAIDLLLKSKWAMAQGKENALFPTRRAAIDYMECLLKKNMFHRAAKIQKKVKQRRLDATANENGGAASMAGKARKRQGGVVVSSASSTKSAASEDDKEREESSVRDEDEEAVDVEVAENNHSTNQLSSKEKRVEKRAKLSQEEEREKQREKRREEKRRRGKMRIEMHDSQHFVDGDEVYVWIFDPVRPRNFILGLLLVFAAVGLCLFPMWPEELRGGVYYLSMGGLVLMCALIALALFRYVVFAFVWTITLGRHHFWYFPNLTEDCGVLESFVPLYSLSGRSSTAPA